MEWVGVKSAAKYRLCRCRCRCKINNLMRERVAPPYSFILHGLPASLAPFLSFDPYPALASAPSFSPTLLCSNFRLPDIAGCLRPFSAYPTASPAELQSHRRILALGLTERYIGENFFNLGTIPLDLPHIINTIWLAHCCDGTWLRHVWSEVFNCLVLTYTAETPSSHFTKPPPPGFLPFPERERDFAFYTHASERKYSL